MDELIERFIHSKLDNDEEESVPPSYTDRSTWAQVVSGQEEEEDKCEKEKYYNNNNNNSSNSSRIGVYEDDNVEFKHHQKQQQHYKYQQNEETAEPEGWETVGGHYGKSPQKYHKETTKLEGWETVGGHHGKSPHRYHKVPAEQWQSYKQPPSEQSYADDAGNDIDLEPTEEELSDLSKACSRLWELDLNRLVPGKDYEIDCGEGKKPFQEGDIAQNALFSWVSKDLFRRPTYSRFYVLLDNYNPSQGSCEVVTSEEQQEQAAFIEEISRTAPIKYLHKYLVAKGLTSPDYAVFKRKMKSVWFDLFDRSGTSGSSSAFEHVFVGEVKWHQIKEVSGFHNWIQFFLEESKGRVDYQGYICPRRRGQFPDSETQLLTIQFTWNGVLKSVSSSFIGVSPEFEIALYTLCFYVGREDNHVKLGPYNVNVKCYALEGDKIGSVFPIAQD